MKLKDASRDRPEPYLEWLTGLSPLAQHIAKIQLCESVPSCSREEFEEWAEGGAAFRSLVESGARPAALQLAHERACELNAAIGWRPRRALAAEYDDTSSRKDFDADY